MAQNCSGNSQGPTQIRPGHQPIKKASIDGFKEFHQVMMLSFRPGNMFPPPLLAHQMQRSTHLTAIEIRTVAAGI